MGCTHAAHVFAVDFLAICPREDEANVDLAGETALGLRSFRCMTVPPTARNRPTVRALPRTGVNELVILLFMLRVVGRPRLSQWCVTLGKT